MSTLTVRNVVSPDGGVSDNLVPITATAWVEYNGTTNIINKSHNVLGVADTGVGSQTVTLSIVTDDAFYAVLATIFAITAIPYGCQVGTKTTADFTVASYDNGVPADAGTVNVVVFGGQS